MATNVHVTSVDALGTFRSELIVFLTSAQQVLDEVHGEVKRTRQWVQYEQRTHWESEIRRRQKKLDAALQDLLAARMSSLLDDDTARTNLVTKARRALREAEEKLRGVKYWDRNFDLVVGPIVKQMGGLRTVLDHKMPKAIAFLANAQQALDAYAEKMGTSESPPPSESSPMDTPEQPRI